MNRFLKSILIALAMFIFFNNPLIAKHDLQTPEEEGSLSLIDQGLRYQRGVGVAQDYEKAAYFYQLAANNDMSMGYHNLGVLYSNGNGVEMDQQAALTAWKKASDLGNKFSTFNIAHAYRMGKGVDKSVDLALHYYFQSYTQGYKPAACEYSVISHEQSSVDIDALISMLKDGANLGLALCQSELVNVLYNTFKQHLDGESIVYYAKLAAQNNVGDGHFILALVYDFGKHGVASDSIKAREHYLKAAEHGVISAYSNLGFLYESGRFGEPDLVIAKKYYELAVERNSQWGYNNLATFYRKGLGKSKDLQKAFELYSMSAEMGNSYAHRNLGVMYRDGEGVDVDPQKAEYHLLASIKLGYPQTHLEIAILYLDKNHALYNRNKGLEHIYKAIELDIEDSVKLLARNLTNEESLQYQTDNTSSEIAYYIAEHFNKTGNIEQACQWYSVAFEQQIDNAFYGLAKCLDSYNYVHRDIRDPHVIIRQWANLINFNPDSLIGELYYFGDGLPENDEKAHFYFKKAVEHDNDAFSLNKLGNIYDFGYGKPVNYALAMSYYERAMLQELPQSFYYLGMMYKEGKGVAIDENQAFELIQKAASYQESADAMFEYAQMLNRGYAGKQNIKESHDWYDRAMFNDHPQAACELGKSLQINASSADENTRGEQLITKCE